MNDPVNDGGQHELAISKNAALIRDFIKEMTPEEVVLEMCDERFDDEIREILSHPNYDRTMQKVHLLLDQSSPDKLTRLREIALDAGNFESIVAFDQCSNRMPCRVVNGDRCMSTTQKRLLAKTQMLKLYKD